MFKFLYFFTLFSGYSTKGFFIFCFFKFQLFLEILTDDEDISVEINGMFKADLEGSGNIEEEALFELSSTNSWVNFKILF